MTWPFKKRHPSAQQDRTGEEGYTLLELMVVLLILVLLASVAVPVVFNQLGKARTRTATVQIEALGAGLDFFRIDVGRYPTTEEGLAALIEAPSGLETWAGPYTKKKASLMDPWGRPYEFRSPGQHGEYDLFTLGADNAAGGDGEDADVTSWE